jgi:hypothetical protein
MEEGDAAGSRHAIEGSVIRTEGRGLMSRE